METTEDEALAREAAALGAHLAGGPVEAAALERYARGVRAGLAPLDGRERRLLELGVRHPLLLGPLDAAAALRAPQGGLRRRFFLMFAVLEATPEHARLYLPARTGPLHVLRIAWAGARAVLSALLGLALRGLVR
jgi:hypothetical protein